VAAVSETLQQRAPRRLYLRWADRALFVWLYRHFPRVLDVITIVRPETVVRWHRTGFARLLAMEVSSARWRPWISKEVRDLIRRMSFENPLWGAPKIHGELLKIGIDVAPVHGFEIHGAEARSTIADLEDLPSQSCGGNCVD
jgi:hypothetical protein